MIGLKDLTWYPKANGAGDIDGAGSKRLLGQPELDLCSLLVRETAQNSWDARNRDQVPEFQIRLRTLGHSELDVLRWNIFRETAPGSRLEYLLQRQKPFDAIEISDRNTKGLGGALRNDLVTEGVHDWVDFVLAVGAPPDNERGGGTYGFGKTASYVASRCSTIVIWSAIVHAGRVEHRFIASAMDSGFSLKGERFTGRQWWGLTVHESQRPTRIEPLLGDEAKRLGEALFEHHFGPHETGTSLLILDPWDPDADGEASWRERVPLAVMENLWPKLVPDQAQQHCMDIALYDHGEPVPIVPSNSPTFDALGHALSVARRGKQGPATDMHTTCFDVRLQRPVMLVGHLALTRYFSNPQDPLGGLSGKVALMRAPELIVRSEEFRAGTHDVLNWVGVFRPLDSLNNHFANAEPPAHDAWVPALMNDKGEKRVVNVALREIKTHVRDFLSPTPVVDKAEGAAPTAALSAALAGLAGVATGSRPSPVARKDRKTREGAARKERRSTGEAKLSRVTPLPSVQRDVDLGRERSRVFFDVSAEQALRVALGKLSISIDGSTLLAPDELGIVAWSDGSRGSTLNVNGSGSYWVDVAYPTGVAIEVDVKVAEPA